MGIKTIDCFALPLSHCTKLNEKYQLLSYNYSASYRDAYNLSSLILSGEDRDICDMGAMLSKPTIWVLGQLLLYHLRPRAGIEEEIQRRVRLALDLSSPKSPGVLTLAMHIRSGMDNFEVTSISRYAELFHSND